MPALNATVFKLNDKFDPTKVARTAANAGMFAPGERLQASFVFPDDPQLRRVLQRYLDSLPTACTKCCGPPCTQAHRQPAHADGVQLGSCVRLRL